MDDTVHDPRAFIQANLPLVAVDAIPEIRLHRAKNLSGLSRLAEDNRVGPPYWAYPWPGGLALALHLMDHKATVRDRRVLDLGAGGGLIAIAAAKAGAREVIAAEIDRFAIAALQLNASANGVTLTVVSDDLTKAQPPAVDLVLAGDAFYAKNLARRVTAFLDRCVSAGIDVLVGDIGRKFLPLSGLRRLADYPVPEVGESPDRPSRVGGVFAFEPAIRSETARVPAARGS